MINSMTELRSHRANNYTAWRDAKESGDYDLAGFLLENLTLLTLLESMPPTFIKDENKPIEDQFMSAWEADPNGDEF